MVDNSLDQPVRLFESGAILHYLAEKFDVLLPESKPQRAECMSWLFWQMSAAPMLGGGFGHFYWYVDEKHEYPINRFTLEFKRQLDLLNTHLSDRRYICGDEYTIADVAIAPWYGSLIRDKIYDAAEFLGADSYTHIHRWVDELYERPAFIRGRLVNRTWGDDDEQLPERHAASDIDAVLKRQNNKAKQLP